VKIAALQETKLNSKSKPLKFQDYSLVCKDRLVGRGGGVAFLIHHSVRYSDLDTSSLLPDNDQTLELQGITANIDNSDIKIFNIYIPLVSTNVAYSPDSKILDTDDDALVLGDFNALHPAWFSSLSDARGDSLVQQVEDSNFFILNTDTPTRLPPNGNSTSPDLSLISAHLALSVSWSTNISLNSDHLPISVSFNDDLPLPRTARTYTNFKRAKWGLWTSETENLFRNAPKPISCLQGVKSFQNILLKASKHHILSGFRKDLRSGVPRAAVSLAEERDRRRSIDPHDPKLPRIN
jgi:hypothetical protein